MNLKHEANKLLTNKYFLYFIVFLSATNVIGYLTMNKINTVIFFALISLLTYHFSKNMSVVLLISLVITNLLMANKRVREGMENEDSTAEETSDTKLTNSDVAKVKAVQKIKNSDKETKSNLKVKQAVKNVNETNSEEDSTTDDSEKKSTKDEGFKQPEGVAAHAKKIGKNNGSRLDYASTLEQSYDNLDKMLGSDGINKLTKDTQRLMTQQQKLFDTMSAMTPMLQEAKKMVGGFDLSKLGLTDTTTKL